MPKALLRVVSVGFARDLTSPVVSSDQPNNANGEPALVNTSGNSESRNSTRDDMLKKIGVLHEKMLETSYNVVGPRRKYIDSVSADFGENGGELKGNKFTLHVPGCTEWRENLHHVRVREQHPETDLKLPDDGDIPCELLNAITTHGAPTAPIYDVEIKARNKDAVATGINLTMSVQPNREFDTEFLIIGKDESSVWKDITKRCSVKMNFDDKSVEITIPIEKSSKVWVVRMKRSFNELADVLLAVFFGQALFHILMFYKVYNKTVKLRIIGVNDELCQKTVNEVCIAIESGFQKVEESNPKQLIKKGKLLVSFSLSGNCQKSFYFGLGGGKESKGGQRADFEFSIGDLESIPRIEIQTTNEAEEVLWSYDVQKLINIDESFEDTMDNVQPEFVSNDDKVTDEVILNVAHQVNKDWKKLGVSLGIHMEDLDIIEANGATHNVVDKCTNMLKLWRKNGKRTWDKPTLQSLKAALEKPEVGRYDIFQRLHSRNQIKEATLLTVAHELGSSWKILGSILNIPAEEIDIIDSDEPNVVAKGMRLLQKWKQGENPSMEELINALRDPLLKRKKLANNLENSCSV